MLTSHFILHWYLQKGAPEMLSTSAKSSPVEEIQDFVVCQTIQRFVSQKVPFKC